MNHIWHVNESWVTQYRRTGFFACCINEKSHICEWVMPETWMSYEPLSIAGRHFGGHVNESYRIFECVISDIKMRIRHESLIIFGHSSVVIWMSHVTREWVMFDTWMSHELLLNIASRSFGFHMNESCRTFECIMSDIRMRMQHESLSISGHSFIVI